MRYCPLEEGNKGKVSKTDLTEGENYLEQPDTGVVNGKIRIPSRCIDNSMKQIYKPRTRPRVNFTDRISRKLVSTLSEEEIYI